MKSHPTLWSGYAVLNEKYAVVLATLPYARHLGVRVADVDLAGEGVLQLRFADRLIGNAALPAYHGGVVATLMQLTALIATAVLKGDGSSPKLVDFSIDYLSSAGPADLFARCEVHRIGRRIAAVGVRCWQQDPNRPLALGRAHLYVAESISDSPIV